MSNRPQQQLLQSYILPLVLAIVILAVSQLLNLVHVAKLLEACGLCAIAIVGLFVGQYVAFKTLRMQERDALYGILSVISFSSSHRPPNAAVLTESDVLGLESAAHEVWIYAYDLNYERFDKSRSSFTNAVATNLQRGVSYVYLVPNSPEIIHRAQRMNDYLSQYATHSKQLRFHVASIPPLFNQFSVTLYNPDTTISSRPNDDEDSCSTIAVFFPHANEFASVSVSIPFLAVRDNKALEIQEKFEALLINSRGLLSEQR
jgi:hypothetical protein